MVSYQAGPAQSPPDQTYTAPIGPANIKILVELGLGEVDHTGQLILRAKHIQALADRMYTEPPMILNNHHSSGRITGWTLYVTQAIDDYGYPVIPVAEATRGGARRREPPSVARPT